MSLRTAEADIVQRSEEMLHNILLTLPQTPQLHMRTSPFYAVMQNALRSSIQELFSHKDPHSVIFGPFGQIFFPYTKMGMIDSMDLFGLDELIIFSYYRLHRYRYKNVADVGANIGLHSILLDRCGYNVRAYEPDPKHVEYLRKNIHYNTALNVEIHETGVSDRNGTAEFIHVLGNTTSSHIAGSKIPYGDLEHFDITLEDIRPICAWADLLKIDAEGHEVIILKAIPESAWSTCDAIVEIGTPENANILFQHFSHQPVHLFTQKRGWDRIASLEDMPTSYRDGSLFITSNRYEHMIWHETYE